MAVVESYKPSGKLNWGRLPIGLALGGGVGAGVTALYAVLNNWNLLGYIPLSILGIHAGEVGVLLYLAATVFGLFFAGVIFTNASHNRNPLLGGGIGLGMGLFFLYIQWMTLGLLAGGVFVLPHEVIFMMQAMISEGWTSFSLLDSPGSNWVFWGIEGLIIVGTSVAANISSSNDPYCENCEEWADSEEAIDYPFAAEPDLLSSLLQEGRVSELMPLRSQSKPHEPAHRYRFTLKKCPSCDSLNTVTVETVTLEYDEDGDATENTDEVVENLILSTSQLGDLRAVFEGPVAEPPVDPEQRIEIG